MHPLDWLKNAALPLWLERGIDWQGGGFFEALSLEGEPVRGPKRSMVQARQIYSVRTAMDLKACEMELGRKILEHGLAFLLGPCSLPNGGFAHSVGGDTTPDLYAQAFALFGMAHGYAVLPSARLQERSAALIDYLRRERRLGEGGYSELQKGQTVLASNPHMHLFEAALSWMETDKDPLWKSLADEVLELCLETFIDPASGLLCEHFTPGWKPVLTDGKFAFEPGHHYEWAWLMGRYEKLTGRDLSTVRRKLFDVCEKHGLHPERRACFDEVWSDLKPKTLSSRFWPQCERAKAAVQFALSTKDSVYARAAEEALTALSHFFETKVPGLWTDTWLPDGSFRVQDAKASSLYHIIGAINEHALLKSR